MSRQRGIRFTIRAKLLLASLTLLVVPWLGYQYIQALEDYLRQAQEEKQLQRVSLVASLLDDQPGLLQVSPAPVSDVDSHLYVRRLNSPILLDGYLDDWRNYDDRRQPLGISENKNGIGVFYRFGVFNDYLYLIFEVSDDKVIYRQPDTLRLDRSDHLRIGMLDNTGVFRRYRLTTMAPGWVHAYQISETAGQVMSSSPEFRIKGEWQEVSGGYNIEIRIPVDMIGGRLAFAIADVDDASNRQVTALVASADTEHSETLGSIVIPSANIEALLQRLQQPMSRIWVVDPGYRVVAMAGSLAGPDDALDDYMRDDKGVNDATLLQIFYRLVLDQPGHGFQDHLSSASRMRDAAVVSALNGQARASWRQTADAKTSIITAAYPLLVEEKIVGAVAIEETSDSILILQNRAIEALVNMSVLAFLLTIGVLLLFATRLSLRVRRLRDEVEASIAEDGRIQGGFRYPGAGDELGDLGRSFHNMHARLAQYNRYLETMASKLAHELRTPITIVRSSLDNLELERFDDQTRIYLDRAHDGINRLSGILGRMSEATHLEQTISQEQLQQCIPFQVVSACVAGYRLAHPQRPFQLEATRTAETAAITGSPELLAQLLDKLVSNALDFALPQTAISITMDCQGDRLILAVANQGPGLPEEMRASLFDSMVSIRQGKSDQPHLGLGLYIVRLIADYHQASVDVENLVDRQGVVFRVKFPLS